MYALIAFAAGVFASCVSHFTDKLEKHKKKKALFVGLVAAIAGIAGPLYKSYEQAIARPVIKVECKVAPEIMVVRVRSDNKRGVKLVRVGFHLPARIKDVRHQNTITDGRADVVVIGGTQAGYLTNRLEIEVYELHPGRFMEFSIFTDKVDEVVMDYAGRDVYELTYIWSHDSKDLYESEWRNIHTNERTRMPAAAIGVIRFIGDAKHPRITWTMHFNRKATHEEVGSAVTIKSIKDDFSYDGEGVDDFAVGALPRRLYQ